MSEIHTPSAQVRKYRYIVADRSEQGEQDKPLVRLLKNLQVRKMIPMSNGRLYSLMDKNSPYYSPDFPTPIRLNGGRSVYWIEAEILEYIERNIQASRGGPSNNGGSR
jgi:predicted DNA-binding transcriptional regulator AlpA